jgi:hypothetical protein
MKRAVTLLPFLFLAFAAFAQTGKQPKPLTNADVIEMSRAGVPESTILLAIQNGPVKFDVSADGILELHAAGITEPVLNQMLHDRRDFHSRKARRSDTIRYGCIRVASVCPASPVLHPLHPRAIRPRNSIGSRT